MYKTMASEISEKDNGEDEGGKATVKIDRNFYNRLKLLVKKKETDIQTTVNKLVKNFVTKEEIFEKYSPLLSIVNKHESSIFIKDWKVGPIVEVILKYKDDTNDKIVLYCCSDKSEYCVHTVFAAASDEIGELKIQTSNAKCS